MYRKLYIYVNISYRKLYIYVNTVFTDGGFVGENNTSSYGRFWEPAI